MTEIEATEQELRAVARTIDECLPEFKASAPDLYMDSALAKRICREAADEIKRLREALEAISDGDYEMPHHDIYRSDGVQSKHDRCPHGQWMYDGCDECCAEFARKALEASK